MLAQHLNQVPAPVRSRRPEVPAELDQLVMELLRKDPQHRPADAAEVARRLHALREPAAAATVPATAVMARPAARVRTAPAAAGGGGAVGGPGRSAARRAGALTGVLVGGSWRGSPRFPGLPAGLLGLLAGICVAAGSGVEARAANGDELDGQGSVVGVFAAMLIAGAAMVALLVWSPAPWWAPVLVGTVTGPVIVAVAAGVRALVKQLLRRGGAEAELAATAGLFSGALGCALTATSVHGSVAGAVEVGAGIWVASSLAVAALLPSPRQRTRHL